MPFVRKYYVNVGEKFGSLIVIAENLKGSKSLVRCNCGTDKVVRNSDLVSGRTQSCGKRICFVSNTGHLSLEGKRFGFLIAIKFIENIRAINGSLIWLCKCVCGKECKVNSKHLVSGATKSCGCQKINLKLQDHNYLSDKNRTINFVYDSYKRGASRREIDFYLSKEEIETLIFSNCHYCGCSPDKTYLLRRTFDTIEVNYTGIDRLDSDKNYVIENCVACCWICNRAKSNSTYEKFLNWINQLVLFRSSQ